MITSTLLYKSFSQSRWPTIQEERVRNANLTTVMAIIVAILVFIIAGLIFSKYRQKARSSREIEHKNTIITEKNQDHA